MITNLKRVIKESIENAEREGHRAAMENIAGNMLAENETIGKIVRYTGLTEKEITGLKN